MYFKEKQNGQMSVYSGPINLLKNAGKYMQSILEQSDEGLFGLHMLFLLTISFFAQYFKLISQ